MIPALFALSLISGTAFAHPMGNFSINHYGKIKIGQASVEILYLVDIAEIPTYQDMRQFGMTTQPEDPGDLRYVDAQDTRLKQGLTVEIDDQAVGLTTISRQVTFAEGAAGLPTMKLSFVFRGKLDVPAGEHKLSYFDGNFPGQAGWKEILALGDGAAILHSTAPEVDRSKELSVYSTDSLSSPPQQLSALVTFQTVISRASNLTAASNLPGTLTVAPNNVGAKPTVQHRVVGAEKTRTASTPSLALRQSDASQSSRREVVPSDSAVSSRPLARVRNTPRSRFTELISTQNSLSFWFLLSAAAIAICLGALHALEPGHGKTIVAAYLIGSRGTPIHAVLLGIVVTAAHTAGVYLLGVVTLYASRYIVPEQLYPWLGLISGLSVTGLGVFIFLKHLTGGSGEHPHAPGEQHSHWFVSMFKQPACSNQNEKRGTSLRELCLLGISGGIVPCPAALVVLLSAFSLHRIGFGLFLIAAFSLGLAGVLVIVGLTMVHAKRWLTPRLQAKSHVVSRLPLLSSAFMVIVGLGIAVSAFASAPIGRALLTRDKLVPFVTVTLLGLFLGMRHSTDSDHVVAVSTIVSRQQSIKSSATIGLLWGLGHTLTIFLVGSAIIIFGVVIPPRLGLSMEFCVALMLIFLGILNLTGIVQWITERWTPGRFAKRSEQGVRVMSAIPATDGKLTSMSSAGAKTMLGATVRNLGLFQTVRPLVVGLIHGLAGSAAVALLVLSTIRNPFWSTVYLLVFGFGTMVGMMLMTAAISAPLVLAGRRFSGINRHLTAVSGLASVAFGMFLVYHIGFVDGLFASHVHWIPQ